MRIYLNNISGIDDAMISMLMSRRTWTRDTELGIRQLCERVLDRQGKPRTDCSIEDLEQFKKQFETVLKWGRKHITLLKFIDLSITVEGLHRAGQDDWDAHAKRYDNRIIRSSTRLATFNDGEMSDYYKGKIIPTDMALNILGLNVPNEIEHNGETYVKGVNGYIKKGMEDDKDVKRGLYMLSIPSNFIFKVNLTEWSHVFKERNADGTANPEVKECCESIANALESWHPQLNRELWREILN